MKRILSIFAIAAIAVAAMAFTTACSAEKKVKKDFGLELYSIRSVLKDAQGDAAKFGEIMKEVAGMGYTTVEPANYKDGKIYGLTPEEFRKALDEAGLRAISTHVSHYLTAEQLETGDLTEALEWWKKCIADFKAAGCAYIITPGMPKTPDEPTLALYCKYYNEVGKLCKAEGLKYGYHNHSYEFKHKLGDVVMYDYLVENTDPDLVFFQMDVYWAVYGNVSPVKYFQKYPGKLTNEIVPKTEKSLEIEKAERTILGVSLSGLFAVWSAFNTDVFPNIISISGSLWYDDIVEWMKEQTSSPQLEKVCMLLGDKEKNSKEKRMATVEERTLAAAHILKEKTCASVTFELVEGTHFSPIMPRLERAFEVVYGLGGFHHIPIGALVS